MATITLREVLTEDEKTQIDLARAVCVWAKRGIIDMDRELTNTLNQTRDEPVKKLIYERKLMLTQAMSKLRSEVVPPELLPDPKYLDNTPTDHVNGPPSVDACVFFVGMLERFVGEVLAPAKAKLQAVNAANTLGNRR